VDKWADPALRNVRAGAEPQLTAAGKTHYITASGDLAGLIAAT
jgi:hypothetical protein